MEKVWQVDKFQFGGESPLTMRARLVCIRHCPDPLGIVTAEQLNKLEFGEEVHMISWIDKEHKICYNDSASASGIRYKFYDYGSNFDVHTIEEIKNFIRFLRKHYFFPIRLNILFCNTQGFRHHIDNHTYYGAFYSMDDEKRKTYPRISIASKITENNSLEDVFCVLAHEITHYYQWYFLEEDKRTARSLEIEANKWSKYVVGSYFNNHLSV